MSNLKTIAITMGDPGGIGPEVIVKTLATLVRLPIRFLIIGERETLKHTARICQLDFGFHEINRPDELTSCQAGVYLFQPPEVKSSDYSIGKPDAHNGQTALCFLQTALKLIQAGGIDALVTAPVSKEAINQAGVNFTGHTEWLAKNTRLPNPDTLCRDGQARTRKVLMMFVTDQLKVSLVTTHLSYRKVSLHLNMENILSALTLTAEALDKYFTVSVPRLAVCGLNPHAGEGGFFGREEKEVIRPALETAQKQGINCAGPFPADSVFRRMIKGEFDAVVALYHDQGLIAVKTVAGWAGCNVTLGLPFIRTSPMHGTAFDIAGKNVADESSMKYALQLAIRMNPVRKLL